MKKSLCALFSLSVSTAMAITPASTADVDTAAAKLQSQINSLNSIPAIAHPVGSCYGGGVVFYATSDANAPAGQRGLIAAPTDAQYLGSFIAAWQTGSVAITTAKTYFTGDSNTTTILSTPGTFPAASAARAYSVEGDTCTECTSWYLPSQNELATLYAQSTSSIALGDTTFWSACNGSTPGIVSYWSSSQLAGNVNFAFAVNFNNGAVTSTVNSSPQRIRAVRAF